MMLSNLGLVLVGFLLAACLIMIWIAGITGNVPHVQPTCQDDNFKAILFIAALILFGLFGPRQRKY